MLNRIGKLYTLKNDYKIAKCECYNGFEMQYSFTIFNPNGTVYMSCKSWNEAYELASHLKPQNEI